MQVGSRSTCPEDTSDTEETDNEGSEGTGSNVTSCLMSSARVSEDVKYVSEV